MRVEPARAARRLSRDTKKPVGVSAYRLLEKLPAKLKGNLTTVEELEAELGGKTKPRDE